MSFARVPKLLQMRIGAVTDVGMGSSLYHRLTHSPRDGLSAFAIEDVANTDNWEVVLVSNQGEPAHEIAGGPGDDLLPAWRADSGELMYVEEVADRRRP